MRRLEQGVLSDEVETFGAQYVLDMRLPSALLAKQTPN